MGTDNNEVKKKARQYSDEFKEEAVKMSQEKGVKATAEELGIHAPMLSNWRKKILNPKSPKKSDELSYAELLAENKKLKKEIGWVKDINEVLKKSTAIFSNDHLDKKK